MTTHLQRILDELPEAPGVYKMLGDGGNILYIGKSKCLKHRVKSYFVKKPVWEKAEKMAGFIRDIEIEPTHTHLEAMLLECELIKKHRPFFNRQMKNDSGYLYIKPGESLSEKPVRILHTREEGCFGPMRSRGSVEAAVDALVHLYPIRREGSGFVFTYHIFPVTMTPEEYAGNRESLRSLLRSRAAAERFFRMIEKKMKEAAKEYRFELAGKYKDARDAFGYIRNQIEKYRGFAKKTMIADIEDTNGGRRLFYIYRGMVVYKDSAKQEEMTEAKREARLEEFRVKGEEMLRAERAGIEKAMQEKGFIDYRDILFAHLASLPKNQVRVL